MKLTQATYKIKEIGEKLKEKSAKERHLIKARELGRVKLNKFAKEGIDITIIDGPKEENGLLSVSVEARINGSPIKINNPLLFKNPPIMVPRGKDFVEDPEEALKIIIVDAIRWQR